MKKETIDKINSMHIFSSHSMRESEVLHAFAYLSKNYGAIVEVGSSMGRSAVILASATDKNVYCIDSWNNFVWAGITKINYKEFLDGEVTEQNAGDRIYELFLKNTDHLKNIIVVKGTREAFNSNEKIGMVFIDGAHNYPEVKADLIFAKSLNPKFILLHDWGTPTDRDIPNAVFDTLGRTYDYLVETMAVFINK